MTKIITSVEINHRVDFAHLANARGVKKIVEVGTDRGVFARQLMQNFHGEIICIDPWIPYPEMDYGREPDMMQSVLALQPWLDRVRFLRAKSPEVAQKFPDAFKAPPVPRFVYLDGAHDYESIALDIVAWWNFLPSDGILAGHDYDSSHPGVMQAVRELAESSGCVVRLTSGDELASWYAYKTEPEKLKRCFWESGEIENTDR